MQGGRRQEKDVQSPKKKKNNKSDKSYVRETVSDKVTPTADFTNDPVVQFACDAPVAKDTFVDDSDMQIIANKF